MNQIIENIRKELKDNMDEKAVLSSRRFFKEELKLYGVKAALVHQISKKYFKSLKGKTKKEIFDLCEQLMKSGYFEETMVACRWAYFVHKQYEPSDFDLFEKWIEKYISNWACCDTLCNHPVGEFLEMYPEFVPKLKKWAKSKNRWMRRASAVSLIWPAIHGKFLKEILDIADILLLDKDDLVQKGYGWMLKSASQSHQKEIFDYLIKNKDIMPRTALRYAIEKMPSELKKKAMERPTK